VLRHHDIPHYHETVTLARLFQNREEAVATTSGTEERQSPVAGASDKVQVMSAVSTVQSAGHSKPIVAAASYPPLQNTQGRGTQSSGTGRETRAERLGHPPADAEKGALDAEGATKTGTTLPGTNRKVDGTVTETGQKIEVKSGDVVANTGQLQATGDAARAATGQPLLVTTTNPNVHVTAPAAANPNLEIRPVKQPQQ
jgi:hypothetical protein